MKKNIKKTLIVIIGSIIMGIGVALAVKGGQGADPLSVFWDGLSRTFNITLGEANLLVSLVMLIVAAILDYKQLNIGTILNPLFLSGTTDLIINKIVIPDTFILQLLQSLTGVALMGIGIGLYTSVDIGKGVYDAIVFSLVDKTKFKLQYIRNSFDAVFLLGGFLLGGSVGLATLLAVLLIGKLISISNKVSRKYIKFD
ncbi:YitT family protein [Clostridium sp.]|uniref:YczE/YyaS/YitT family protein n=1 Tax=Clostridium sp. TaxID=1506 RepID=UPI00261AFD91|nr:YitT family protein [Clostridium sp.]